MEMGWGPVKMARHLCNSGLEDIMIILGKLRMPEQEKKNNTQSNHKSYCGIISFKKLYTAKTPRNTVSIHHFAFKDLSLKYFSVTVESSLSFSPPMPFCAQTW